jgi:hypothetical protein
VDKVINAVFPVKKDESDIQRRNREEINGTIRALYASQKNAGGFGYNGWSIYNSVVEYLDHYRKGDANDLALATIEENSWTNKAKVTAQHAVLQLV